MNFDNISEEGSPQVGAVEKRVEWNKVTWYSKLLAIIFFIGLLPVLTFFIGMTYGEVSQLNKQADLLADSAVVLEMASDKLEPAQVLEVTYPTGGEVLCKEESSTIQWKAPVGVETVSVSLITPSSSTRIGDYPAVNRESTTTGESIIPWDFTNAAGFEVADSNVYKMMISGTYKGEPVSALSQDIFTIQTCAGQ